MCRCCYWLLLAVTDRHAQTSAGAVTVTDRHAQAFMKKINKGLSIKRSKSLCFVDDVGLQTKVRLKKKALFTGSMQGSPKSGPPKRGSLDRRLPRTRTHLVTPREPLVREGGGSEFNLGT